MNSDPLNELQATNEDVLRAVPYNPRIARRTAPAPWRLRGNAHPFRVRVFDSRWLKHIAKLSPRERGYALIEYLEKPSDNETTEDATE